MNYDIEISSVAETEADKAFLRLSKLTSVKEASQWYSGLLQAIEWEHLIFSGERIIKVSGTQRKNLGKIFSLPLGS